MYLRPALFAAVLGATLSFLPAAAQAAPPANDNFANRTKLTGTPVVNSVSNVEATHEAFDPSDYSHTVWWSWTAPRDGTAHIAVSGVNANNNAFTSELAVFSGSSLDSLKLVGVDVGGGTISFPTAAGAVYQISAGNDTSLGTVTLSIALGESTVTSPVVVGTPAAANDNFANRTKLAGTTVSGIGYNYDATHESFERDDSARTLWWTWTAPANAMVTVSTAGTIHTNGGDFSPQLSVFTGATIDVLKYVATNFASPSTVTFPAVAGTVYQISTGNDTSVGAIVVNVTTTPLTITSANVFGSLAAANDNYSNAQSLGSFASVAGFGYNTDATLESLESSVNRDHTLWWTWTAPANGILSLDTTGSDVSNEVNAYTGDTIATAVNVDDLFTATSTGASAHVQAGTTYHFPVGSTQTGTLVLNLNFAASATAVSVAATTPSVVLGSGAVGAFTINLSTPLAGDIKVAYVVKGSGINGLDYVYLKGTTKIKAGKTSKVIKVVPQGNLEGAGKKVVKLTLAAGAGYTISTPGAVKVKILAR